MRTSLYSILFVAVLVCTSPAGAADSEPSTPHQDTAQTPQPAPVNPVAPDMPSATPSATGVERSLPPLRVLITSPFGPRAMPGWLGRGGKPVRMHNGIDIRARIDWPVVAFKSGTVRLAGPNGALGLSVIVQQDDGMKAYYGHLGKILVKVGQHVTEGTPVGHVGCTGRTTGAHLHFGLHNAQGAPVDPLPLLDRAEQLLRPSQEQIPAVLEAQSCGGLIIRGRNGLPVRFDRGLLRKLDSYSPPPIPAWGSK